MSEENTEKIYTLDTLRYNAGIWHPISVAKYCYDYIDENLLGYLKDRNTAVKVEYYEDESDYSVGMQSAEKRIDQIRRNTESFIAELHEAMMYYLLDNPPRVWPEARVKVDNFHVEPQNDNRRGSEVAEKEVNRFFSEDYCLDLLKEHTLPLHQPEGELRLESLRREETDLIHPIRHLLGWIVSFLMGINLLEGILYKVSQFDLKEWLQTDAYEKLTGKGLDAVAKGLQWFAKNNMITPDKSSGPLTGGTIIAVVLVSLLFLLITGNLIKSSIERRKVKRRIAELEASEELKIQRERRQQVRDRYHEMMEQWREAVQEQSD